MHLTYRLLLVVALLLGLAGFAAADIQSNGTGGGLWSATTTWAGGIVPIASDNVIIVAGDSVGLGAAQSCTNLTINSGGKVAAGINTLTVTGSFTMQANATFYQAGTVTTTPGATRSFDNASLFVFNGSQTSITSNFTFGSLAWRSSSNGTPSGNLQVNGNLLIDGATTLRGSTGTSAARTQTVVGNVIISGATNTTGITATNGTQTGIWNIGGNVTLSGLARMFCGTSSGTSGTGIYNIDGNLTIGSGCELDYGSNGATTGLGIINLKGNLTIDGTLKTNLGTGSFNINFVGAGTQTVSGAGTVGALANLTDTVASGATLAIPAGFNFGTSTTNPAAGSYVVNGTLDMQGNSTLQGANSIVVNAGGTLKIADANGLTSTAATGNIQVAGTRTYNTGANFEFDGTSAQSTGDQLPAAVNNLTVNNSAGLSLTSPLTVNGVLGFTSGILAPGANALTLGSSASTTGAGSGKYVNGSVTKTFATGAQSFSFPIGDATNYTAVDLSFGNVTGGGSVAASTAAGDHPNIGTSDLDASKSVNRNYTLTNTGTTFDNYSATFNFQPGDVDLGANTNNFVVRKYDGAWSSPTIGAKTSTSTQATGMTSMSSFAVAEPAAPPSAAPTVNSPIAEGATSVSGTSTEGDGTTIEIFVDNVSAGTTTVSTGAWTKTGLTALTAGQTVKATATAAGKSTSAYSNVVTVQAVTAAPTVGSPIADGATSVSGTSTEGDGTTIEIFVDNVSVGTTTVATGAWTKSGLAQLNAGQAVKATATASGKLTSAFSNTVTVTAGLAITTSSPLPAATAGTAYAETLAASGGTPPYGSWHVSAGSLPSGLALAASTGILSGTPTVAGPYSFTATVVDAGSDSASKAFSLTVNPGALDHFAFASVATPETAGVAFGVTMTAQDANNNTVTSFTGTVTLSTTAGTIAPATSGAFTAGVRAENVTVSLVGTGKTISADDGSGHTGTSNTFDVVHGALHHFAIASVSTPQTAGTPFGIGVTAQDVDNNTVTSFTGTVNLSTTAGSIAPTTSDPFTAGTLSQSVTVTQSGTGKTLSVNDGSGHAGTSNTFDVNPGTVDHFAIAAISSPQSNTLPFNITITAKDANNNTATSFTSTVTIALSSGTIAPTTSGAFAAGTRTESVTITTAGTSKTISVDDGSAHTGTSNAFDVVASQTITSNGTGGGSWASTSTWQGGVVPTAFDSVIVLAADSVSVAATTSCSGLLIDGKVGMGARLNAVNVVLNGTLTNTGDTLRATGSVNVGAAGTYNHARNGGSLPLATWAPGSTLLLTGITANAPSNGKQAYSNVVWNCPSQSGSLNLGWHPTVTGTDSTLTIGGNITVLSTGTGRWQMSAPPAGTSGAHTTARININGNVTVSGGATFTSNGTSNGFTDIIITILGNVSVSGSATQLAISRGSQGSGSGTAVWNFKGASFTMGPGTVSQNSNAIGGKFVFDGTSPQTVTIDTLATLTGAVNWQFGDGTTASVVDIGNDRLGGSGCTQTIKANAKVIVGASGFIGGGTSTGPPAVPSTFTLENGATLAMAQPKGILSAGSSGTVQVSGTRSYGTGANYEYVGTAAQKTGGGLPATVNNLVVNNAAGVTLDSTALVTVNGTLGLTSGQLVTGTNSVLVPSTASVTRTTGYVVGTLQKGIPAGSGVAKSFEIGDAAAYAPVALTFGNVGTPGVVTGSTTAGDHPQIATAGLDAAKSVNRYYTLTNSGTAFDNYGAVFTFDPADVDGGANTANFIVKKYDSPTWSATTTGTRTATSTEATGMTSFSDFAIGEVQTIITYTLTVNTAGSGTVAKVPDQANYNAGDTVHLTANPAVGNHLVAWSGDASGNANPLAVVMTSNKNITATFAVDTLVVTASVIGGNGVIAPSGAVQVLYGADQAFTMTPNGGYHIDSIFVDGGYIGNTSPDTIKNVTVNHTIAVKFAIDTYTLTVNAVGNGSVNKAPDQATYDAGSSVQLTAVPANYTWTFMGWSGDATGSTNPLNVTMDGNKNITATFAQDPAYLAMYRSFTLDSIAHDKDQKGKVGKLVPAKPWRVEFDAPVRADSNLVTDLHIEFGSGLDTSYPFTFTRPVSAKSSTDGKFKKWDITFTTPLALGDTVKIHGMAVATKIQKVGKYIWKKSGVATSRGKKDVVVASFPRLPKPNRVNGMLEIFTQSGFAATSGLQIGVVRTDSVKKYGWLLSPKYTDAYKTLVDKTGEQNGLPRPIDVFTTNGRPILKLQKNLPPTKFNNRLLGNLVVLKLNIAASALSKTPLGFGELVYNDGTSNPLNGRMLKEIAALADTMMSARSYHAHFLSMAEYDALIGYPNLDSTVARINAAFEGTLDTTSVMPKIVFTGVRSLASVPYLRKAGPGVEPTVIVSRPNPVEQIPMAYTLYQNYPNPFNPTTKIAFDLPTDAVVTLKVYNMLGQEIATLFNRESMLQGTQEVEFNAANFASGVYFYRIVAESFDDDGLSTGTFQSVMKMMLIK